MKVKPTQLKYRIKAAFILKFGSAEAVLTAKAEFCRETGITPGTLKLHMNYMIGEVGRIKEEDLALYAWFLGVTVEYLTADYIEFLTAKAA